MYKNFIWDFDGTLVDTDECVMKCYINILEQYNIKEDKNKILNLIKEGSKLKAVEYLISKYKAFTKEDFFEKYDEIDRMQETYDDAKPMKYAIEVCNYIKKRGYKNIVITNRGENTVDILKKLDMDKYFDFIMFYGKDNVFVRKPESGMFDYVIEKFNLNIKETLSIGDRTIDYIASKKNNLPVCLFNAIYDKENVHPEFDIKSLSDIKNIIEEV